MAIQIPCAYRLLDLYTNLINKLIKVKFNFVYFVGQYVDCSGVRKKNRIRLGYPPDFVRLGDVTKY